MKKYLISDSGNFYKANLHCHTTLSDGGYTPERIKEIYKERGYSIVAFTDHDVFLPHNDLTDDNFLALNGFEMEFADRYDCYENNTPWERVKECHICFIAKDNKMELQPFFHQTKYIIGKSGSNKLVKYDVNDPDLNFERWYDKKCINYVMKKAKQLGFFVTYNHPTWSNENYSNYILYDGMDAFEMFNGCLAHGCLDYNPIVYDDLLRSGKKLYCIGADDTHWIDSVGVCWTMIKAENLTYKSIIENLEKGNFYCSEGPEIYELYVENGVLKIKCSNAQAIKVNYNARKAHIKLSEDGTPVTSAEFTLSKDHGYFRVTVVGLDGKKACTNAYYPEDIDL